MRRMSKIGSVLLSSLLALALLVPAGGCKRTQNTDADTAAATTKGAIVSGFVTRENDYIDTAIGRKHMISMAARIGLKRVFVNVWSRGCTLYRSNTMKTYGGPEICPGVEGDPLGELMRYGKTFKIEVVPWFEWGNILPARSALWTRNKSRGWSGFEESFHTVPSIRVNPYKGDFDDFFAALMKEVVTRYGAREIHICDNFAPHTTSGAAMAIKGPQAFTAFAKKVIQPSRAAGARVSLSSQRRLNSLESFSIDWGRWLSNGIVDWVYPQLYHVKEANNNQFINEAKSERAAGAIGVALYTGPETGKWTLEAVGRRVKLARSIGLETVLFDFNTLLSDQKANTNADVQRIATALGTRMRMDINPAERPPAPKITPPPPPVLPPPETTTSPIPTVTRNPTTPEPNVQPTAEASQTAPIVKAKLCEYMKITGAPDTGAPTYLSSAKGEIIDYTPNEQLAYRHLTQMSIDGDQMMYVTLYGSDGSVRVRWVEAKYLVERRPEDLNCTP